MTRLIFINGVLGGSGGLGSGRADIIVGALHEPPQLSDFGFARLGILEQVLRLLRIIRWPGSPSPLTGALLKVTVPLWWATARGRNAVSSQLLDEQEAITVFDFKTKLELQISGLGCGYLPRYLAQRFLDSGALIENRCWLKAVMNRSGLAGMNKRRG